ncbi:hypothetical protein V502_00198 [Pseudogymnoascus sp. VKM F-4520 (FW-2644)]|nr:hypothetical protein V502_00198 [Pseudogymnoascus sp. VKM F-4520 (FW-2644)]
MAAQFDSANNTVFNSKDASFTSKNALFTEYQDRVSIGFTKIPNPKTSNNLLTMSRWGNITSTCARWLTSYRSLESGLVVCAIAEFYTFASLSIYFYCLSGSVDPSSRLSVCHYNYTARSPLTRWSSCISLLVRAITSLTGLFVLVGRMQRARRTRERIEIKHIDPLQFTADILYTKTEMDSLVVENKHLVEMNKSWVVYSEALLVNQEAMLSEFAKWTSKVSDLAISLYNSTVAKGNEQAREEALPLEKEQQQALVGELAALASKLSALLTKQVDLEETKKKVREEKDKLRTKTVEEEHLRMEREKIETEKDELQEERESLEEENEALEAKAKKLGIEEDKLRTTTPEEFQKLVDAQEKLYDDLDKLHDEIKTPSNDKSPEEIARLARDFRVKTRETVLLMNANDKLVEEAYGILESMDCITSDIQATADWGCYWMKVVAGLFVDHIVEDEQAKEHTHVGETVQEQPQIKDVLLDEARPQEKEVLQVGDGLQ